MRVLVTGIAGFAGSHLAEHLVGHGDEVSGTVIAAGPWPENLSALAGRVRLLVADLSDGAAAARAVEEAAPEAVYHLAGAASVGETSARPDLALQANVVGTWNLLDAVRRAAPRARVLLVSSAEVYGPVGPEAIPLVETRPLAPANPYGWSKAAADLLGLTCHRAWGMGVVRVRPFNHTGPRQDARFVVSDWACQVARIEAGLAPPVLMVGDVEVRRDLLHVADVVEAYRLALLLGTPGEVYHVASGRATALGEVLDALAARSRVRFEVRKDPARVRAIENPVLVGSAERLARLTGWAPRRTIGEAVDGLLAGWRAKVFSIPR